ncbi:MAG: hypothetical protein FIA99_18605 [Ruminiclostridium sp.]|nr:hypothetical protein [Ruminiclostridium sp.]
MATIIGAGFASGQEILQFFSVYYEGGFYGIVLAGILFSVLGYIVLDRVYRDRIKNYDEFVFPAFGWFAGWIIEISVTVFMFCLFCIMIAGSGRVLTEKLGISEEYSILVMCFISMVFILTSIKGIVVLSTVVTPVLVTGILFAGLYIISSRDTSAFNAVTYIKNATDNWFFSALIYVSYNSLMSIVVMSSLLPYLKTKRTGRIGGLLGGMLLCFVAFILNAALYFYSPFLMEKELPVLGILGDYSNILSVLYAVILWLAMLLSSVTSGFCFVDRVSSKLHINRPVLAILICAVAIPVSTLGFSRLISGIYPIFGYIGLFMVFSILISGLRLIPTGLYGIRRKK